MNETVECSGNSGYPLSCAAGKWRRGLHGTVYMKHPSPTVYALFQD